MKYVLALITGIAGLVLGALIVLFILGAPRAKPLPGIAVGAPDPAGNPPGTVIVTLDEKFFDPLLATIFRDLGSPTFPLELTQLEQDRQEGSGAILLPAAMQAECPDLVVLATEGSNIK